MTPRDVDLRMKLIDYKNVDVLIAGKVLPEGRMIPKEDAVLLLQGFAQLHGPVLVYTEQLDGRVERDVILQDGSVEPYYHVGDTTKKVEIPLNTSLIDSLQRAVETGVVEERDGEAERSASRISLVQTLDYLDVESELAKLAGKKSTKNSTASHPASRRSPNKLVFICLAVAAALVIGVLVFALA